MSAQDMLTAVEAAILARLNGGAVAAYSIGGRNLQYESLPNLEALREKLKNEIAAASDRRMYSGFSE